MTHCRFALEALHVLCIESSLVPQITFFGSAGIETAVIQHISGK